MAGKSYFNATATKKDHDVSTDAKKFDSIVSTIESSIPKGKRQKKGENRDGDPTFEYVAPGKKGEVFVMSESAHKARGEAISLAKRARAAFVRAGKGTKIYKLG